ncbi:type VI secretion system baseplate subunit TssK [Thaumasiovibrio sp. DFM-14]|uniref:type VI secretion system baseplate subunit TssK n=1 Tax=Thaumasiovibrio sp. DFM-14 TaxID=3384792 RepID=UPI0039A3A0C3
MSLYSPVVWYDGMFMKAQHFQQQDRYHRFHASTQQQYLNPQGWGINSLEVNTELLAIGKIGLKRVSGITQDRVPFNLPDESQIPGIIDVDSAVVDTVVYLCSPLPSEREQVIDERAAVSRYSPSELEVSDFDYAKHNSTSVKIGKLNFYLKLESEDRSSFTSIPILKVSEIRADGRVVLDEMFVPTCIDINASSVLTRFVNEFCSMLKHRAESIIKRLGVVDQQGVSSVADIMLLQTINRLEPLLNHINATQGVHPETLFSLLIQVEGELATLCSTERRAQKPVVYSHVNLSSSFSPVLASVKCSMGMMSERRAMPLALKEQGYGIKLAHIAEKSVLEDAVLVLAVKADVTVDMLHKQFVMQTKVGSVSSIRDLINLQLPGIGLKAMPVVPRQLPYHAGYTYFEMQLTGEDVTEISNAAGIAIHVSGDFPGLVMQLWAVKS